LPKLAASRHGESVEHFDQTVGLSIHDLDCCSSRLIFKPKADLNGNLEFLDFVFFNQPAHLRHFKPVYMAQCLAGLRHGVLSGFAKAGLRDADDFNLIVNKVMSL
jgi:hypothetical protein